MGLQVIEARRRRPSGRARLPGDIGAANRETEPDPLAPNQSLGGAAAQVTDKQSGAAAVAAFQPCQRAAVAGQGQRCDGARRDSLKVPRRKLAQDDPRSLRARSLRPGHMPVAERQPANRAGPRGHDGVRTRRKGVDMKNRTPASVRQPGDPAIPNRGPRAKATADVTRALPPGRAPVPPEWNDMMLKTRAFIISSESASIWLEPPKANRFHRQDVPSAGTWSSSAWLRQPITRASSV